MPKKILIIAPGYSKNSTDPCCKEIYRFLSVLSEKRKQDTFYVLTSQKEKTRGNIVCFHIDQYNRLCDRIEKINPRHFLIKKIANRLFWKRAVSNLFNATKFGHATYFMDQTKFEHWIKKHADLCKNIDFVFTFSNPFYQHEYGSKIIEQSPNAAWYSFFYDSFADSPSCKNVFEAVEREDRIFERANKIFTLKELVENCKNSNMNKYPEKICFIPNTSIADYTDWTRTATQNKQRDKISLFYSGRFDEKIRNPERMLKVVAGLPNCFQAVFYSRGCEKQVGEFQNQFPEKFETHGFLQDQDEYNRKIAGADFLVIVGNSAGNQIPSKFAEYISFGKPIIYFQSIDDDLAIREYGNYSLLLVVSNKAPINEAVSEIQSFCKKNIAKTLDYATICNLFPSNTLEYLTDILTNQMTIDQ